MLHAGQFKAVLDHSLVIAPTRSGSTSELIRAFESIRAVAEVKIVALAAKPGSEAARAADLAIELPWAFDDSVCQTRSVTNLYAADLLVSAILGGDRAVIEELRRAIDRGERFIADNEAADGARGPRGMGTTRWCWPTASPRALRPKARWP